MWNIHAMNYYSPIKKEERSDPTTQMNLGDVILREISQARKDRSCMIPLIGGIESSQILIF